LFGKGWYMLRVHRLWSLVGKYSKLVFRNRRASALGTYRIEHLRPDISPVVIAWHTSPFAKADALFPHVEVLRAAGQTGAVVLRLSTSDEIVVRWSLDSGSIPKL
jgi:hypothetical protein